MKPKIPREEGPSHWSLQGIPLVHWQTEHVHHKDLAAEVTELDITSLFKN